MATSSSAEPPTQSSRSQASSYDPSVPLTRRRDKRRHQSSFIDLSDPLQVVALAVRFDESQPQAELLLQVPLESGRLYDSAQFSQALDYLQRNTNTASHPSPPPPPNGGSRNLSSSATAKKRPTTSESSSSSSTKIAPPFALTPVILSGLLTAIQQQREEKDGEHSSLEDNISSELVISCQALRKAALNRFRIKSRRNHIQRIVLPLFCCLVLVTVYLRSVSDMRNRLVQLHYVRSCENMRMYEPACRLAEAALWERYRDYVVTSLGEPCEGLDCDHSLLLMHFDQSLAEPPFTMHSTLSKTLITRKEVESGMVFPRLPATRPAPDSRHPYRWLGESTVNRLVRESIHKHLSPKMDLQILDVGCGVGGTLYALLPDIGDSRKFSYHGIAISASEVYHARRLVEHHSLDLVDITFAQKSFDSALKKDAYSVIVAVESLTFSRNLKETLENLLPSLKKGGVMVIFDDVVFPSDAARIAVDPTSKRPSLSTHASWDNLLKDSGCSIKVGYDLTSEYELESLSAQMKNRRMMWHYGVLWEKWFSTNAPAKRLIQLHEDLHELAQARRKRLDEYNKRESLSYHIYVCVKQ